MNNNLSLIKILSGLNKTINITKQVLPIYKQVKPMLSKSGALLSKLNQPINNKISNNQTTIPANNTNNPIFFQ
jgi:hypothetical protein